MCFAQMFLFAWLLLVAVAGLPEPNRLHATVMSRFARDCMYKMHEVTRGLEVELGVSFAAVAYKLLY